MTLPEYLALGLAMIDAVILSCVCIKRLAERVQITSGAKQQPLESYDNRLVRRLQLHLGEMNAVSTGPDRGDLQHAREVNL